MAEEKEVQSDKFSAAALKKKRHGRSFRAAPVTIDPSVPWPNNLDPEDFGPSAFAAVVDVVGETMDETEFHLDPEKLKGLPFTAPGLSLSNKHQYTIKAIHRDGRLVQLPFEDQIQNTAGGDPADAIGIRRYARKGITLLIDWDTLVPVYCPAWGCWAKAIPEYWHFCCPEHAKATLPNTYKSASEILKGFLEQGVTTSRTWKA